MNAHPVANIFPPMSDEQYAALKASIAEHGVDNPIWVWNGEIIDGRHRARACDELGLECPRVEFCGDESDALNLVFRQNSARRDLTASQRAAIALAREEYESKLAKQRQIAALKQNASVTERIPERDKGEAREKAAASVGVNPRYVSDAKAIAARDPDLIDKVRTGEVTLMEAKRQITHRDRPAIVPPSGKYRVIYADPPWMYRNSGIVGEDDYGRAATHYPCMPIEDICALPIGDLAISNSVLFLWTTSPLLEESFDVVRAWGFKYKTTFVWDKVRPNFGFYNSVRHEFLLVCTRGSCTPDVKTLYDSVQSIERTGKHSEKPEEFRQIIDTLYPPKEGVKDRIELFRRADDIPAWWAAWGNEPAPIAA